MGHRLQPPSWENSLVQAAASTGTPQLCPTQPPSLAVSQGRAPGCRALPSAFRSILLCCSALPAPPHALVTAVAKPLCQAPGQQDPIRDALRASGCLPGSLRGHHRGLLPCPAPSSPARVPAGAGTGACWGLGGSRRGAELGPRASSIEHMICCGSFPAAWSQPRASADDGFNCFQIR